MRVVSWNVNGLRAVMGKANNPNFIEWLDASGADVVGLQEVRASAEQLEKERALLSERGWHLHVSGAQKKGYSGVGLLSRKKPDAVETTVGVDVRPRSSTCT